ncbi:MAG: HEAT repeat domain-containing protein [Polyangiales bacterium]
MSAPASGLLATHAGDALALRDAVLAGSLPLGDLIARLSQAGWSERRQLVAALASLGEDAANALCGALVGARDDETRIAAVVDALAASTADVESRLVALLPLDEPALLADVAQILGRRRQPAAAKTLIALSAHADTNVAVAAIEALGRLGGRAAVDALVACVERNDFFRTFPAIDVLGRSGDPRAVAPLAKLLDNSRYAHEAARALGRTADRAAVAPLTRLLETPTLASVRIGCIALSELCVAHEERYGSATAIEQALRRQHAPGLVRRLGHALGGADKLERLAICRVLGALGDPAATPLLLDLVGGDAELTQAASAAMRALGRDSEDALAAALAEPDSTRRAALIPNLTRAAHADALIACLDDPQALVRSLACEALARVGAVDALPALFARLSDAKAQVVHAATAAIQSLGAPATEALAREAARAEGVETRRAALRILAYLGIDAALDVFEAALSDPSAKVREAAIQGLPLLEHHDVPPMLLRLASSDDARTRAVAVRAIGHASPDQITLRALARSLDDADAWVRYYACQALGRLGVEALAGSIVARLEDEAGHVRAAAIEALSHLHGKLAREALRRAAHADDLDVRRAALLGLGMGGDRVALPLLIDTAREGDPSSRLIALSALASFAGDEATEVLAEASSDADPALRTAAIGFLAHRPGPAATDALVARLRDAEAPTPLLDALAAPVHGRVARLLATLATADDELALRLVACLSRQHSVESIDALFTGLGLPSRPARLAAAGGLSALGTREAYAALAQAAAEDADPEVRRVCALHLGS